MRNLGSAVLEAEREQLDPLLRAGRPRDGEGVAVVRARADGIFAEVGDFAEEVVALHLAEPIVRAREQAHGVASRLRASARRMAAQCEYHRPEPQEQREAV